MSWIGAVFEARAHPGICVVIDGPHPWVHPHVADRGDVYTLVAIYENGDRCEAFEADERSMRFRTALFIPPGCNP